MTTKDDREPFLSRWSRLKRKAREEPTQKTPAKPEEPKPAPDLPPVDQLNYDSDFKGFMEKGVDDRLRRLALKKLFNDPRFNVTDGLDDFAEDYSLLEDLPEEMAELQQHARRILRGPETGEKLATGEQPSDQAAGRSDEQPGPAEGGQRQASNGETPGTAEQKDERQG